MGCHRIPLGILLASPFSLGRDVDLGLQPKGDKSMDAILEIGERSIIRSQTIIYAGTKIGADFATGHGALIREHVRIGNFVSVGSRTEIEPYVHIGNNVRIHSHCFIAEGSVIEDNVIIAPGVFFASDKHPLQPRENKVRKGPTILENAYICMRVVILPGCVIGRGSLVGAGSVVTKDVPGEVVVYGNPAKVISGVQEYIARSRKLL